MQTFILNKRMAMSALALDIRRCFKQAVECKQIYLALTGQSKGWTKHPAVLQWKGYADYLLSYGYYCMVESEYEAIELGPWYRKHCPLSQHIYFPQRFHKLIPFHQGLMVRKDYHYYHDIFPDAISTGWARYLDNQDKVFHIKFGEKIYDDISSNNNNAH